MRLLARCSRFIVAENNHDCINWTNFIQAAAERFGSFLPL